MSEERAKRIRLPEDARALESLTTAQYLAVLRQAPPGLLWWLIDAEWAIIAASTPPSESKEEPM